MKHFRILFTLLIFSLSGTGWSCNFCSSKPKSLSSGVPQDLGRQNSPALVNSMGQLPSNTQRRDSNKQPFNQNPSGGQRSDNPNWSSSDFFESR